MNKNLEKTAIYTAVTKNYDDLRDPLELTPNCDYMCFTNGRISSDVWESKKFDEFFNDPSRTAKKPKILPHVYLKNYTKSVWIDGNILIKKDLTRLIDLAFQESDLAVFSHPEKRKGLLEELEKCVELKKDNEDLMRDQVEYYYKRGYTDSDGPFPACYIIFRKHNNESVRDFMEEWWNQITKYSKRDQLSFSYVSWKSNIDITLLDHKQYFGEYFERLKHKSVGLGHYFKLIRKTN